MGALANPYNTYKKHDVTMAHPLELIVMLYNGCIKQLKLTRMAMNDQKFEKANITSQKAQDIIIELMRSLDLSYEISKELINLYEFLHREIMQINVSKNIESIEPLVEILTNLRDTWVQVQKECKTTNPMELNE